MAGGGRTATVLKIRNGSAAHNPSRLRDESRITPKGKPAIPPWEILDADRQVVFDYLVAEFVLPGVHGKPDGLLMTQLVEQIIMNKKANDKIREVGVLMRGSNGGPPVLQPLYKVQRDTSERIVRLMNELGFTPSSRLRFAPPLTGPLHQVASWDDIDS